MKAAGNFKNNFMATIARQWLQADIITQHECARLLEKSTVSSASVHPYISIIDNKLTNQKTGKPITLEFLTQWVAKKNKLDYVKIDPTKINVNQVTQVISQAYARQHQILPLMVNDEEIVIAVADPKNTSWVNDIQKIHRQSIRRVHANPIDIQRLLFEFYGVNRQVQSAKKLHKGKSNDPILNLEQLVKLGGKKDINADDQHVIGLVDWLLQYAFDQRASDIHLEPKRDNCLIRFHRRPTDEGLRLTTSGHGCCHQPHQNPVTHRRGRETATTGWPHQNLVPRKPRNRIAGFHHAHHFWRKMCDADF